MRILVVDDEVMQLKGMKIGLRTEGHMVCTAISGEDALMQVHTAALPFDLVITDYLMGDMNGMDLLRKLRKIDACLPVLLMTAYSKKDLLVEALQLQCSGCLEKPFSFDELLSEIARINTLSVCHTSAREQQQKLAHIVHQINNPLSAIIGNAEMAMHAFKDPDDIRHSLQAIIKATSCIQEINTKILHQGRAQDLDFNWEKVDIRCLLHECLESFEALLAQKKITVKIKMSERDLQVWGDRFGLQQVIKNVLMNAIEAMDAATRKVLRVTAATDKTGLAITVHIADTGCGVSERFSEEISSSPKTSKKNGSGIGLQVVRKMLEYHHGQLYMRRRKGPGTLVSVKLPGPCRHETCHKPENDPGLFAEKM